MENNQSIICTKCKVEKPQSDFYQRSWCRSCRYELNKAYRKTKKGMIVKMYSVQRCNSKKRGDAMPSYTAQELKDWLFSQKEFHALYDNWKNGGYKKDDKPSCDRISDYKPYTLYNLQLGTWFSNRMRYYEDVKTGINTKATKAILQFNKQGEFVKEHYSMAQAAREVGISPVGISYCFSGRSKTAGGYLWKLKETILQN